jgi:serine/threonine protein kinase
MTHLTGQSIGRYHILDQLGEGGMAIVYKAFDTRLERDVAVKVIRTERLTIETMGKTLKRFEREAKALAKLTHPNIVPITDYGEHDGKPYLVMPYLPGGTLKQQLGGKQIPWQDAIRLLLPVTRALHYAHQQGIVHRDVKPANILITQSGEPMLTDFGIAKILLDTEDTFELTGTGMGIGTPEYMSPEQFQGTNVDARTDVYALGVVLYEMVTGRKPYQADTPAAVLIKQATDPLPRPKSFTSNLPDAVERILLKALSKQTGDRYQDMHQFSRALEGTTSQPSPDDRLGDADSKPKTGHRWQRWLWVGVPILLLGVGLWVGKDVFIPDAGERDILDSRGTQQAEAVPPLIPESTPVQSESPTAFLSNPTSPAVNELPTPTKELINGTENILLEDDFTNESFQDSFDKSLWYLNGEIDPSWMHFKQDNGILVGTLNPIDNLDFEMHSRKKWNINDVQYAEWKIKIENNVRGEWANLAVGFETNFGDRFICDIRVHGSPPEISCTFWNPRTNKPSRNVYIPGGNIRKDDWITIRMEYVDDPIGFNLYINEQMIRHVPIPKEDWENQQIHVKHSLGATKTKDPVIGYIDYVIVTGWETP